MIADGRYTADTSASTITVYTFKEGLLSKIAHDLVIDAPKFAATLEVEGQTGQLELDVDAAALKVTSDNVSASQKQEIQGNIRKKVLDTRRHGTISVRGSGPFEEGDHRVTASVTIAGRTRDVPMTVTVRQTGETVELHTAFDIQQTSFGIKPYSAMMGTLKIKDVVKLEGTLRFPPA